MATATSDYAEYCLLELAKIKVPARFTRHSPELGIVPESMGIGFGDAGGLAMLTE